MSVCCTFRTPFVGGWRVAVAEPVECVLQDAVVLVGRAFKFDAHYDDRFRAHLSAELDELVSAEAVLVIVHPHPMCPALSLLLRADAPFPVVLCHVAATRPAQAGGVQFLDRFQYIGTESAQFESSLSSHGQHVNLHRSIFHNYGKIAVTRDLRVFVVVSKIE